MAVKTKNGMFKQVRVQLKIITLTAISFALKKNDGVCRLGCSFFRCQNLTYQNPKLKAPVRKTG